MVRFVKPLGTEVALPTTAGTASTFVSAKFVRLHNSHTAAVLVTIQESDETVVGTFTMGVGETVTVEKQTTHEIFAANAAVLGVRVGT